MALPSSSTALLMILFLLLVSSAQAQSPISLPPASAPTAADSKDSLIAPSALDDTVMSPPAPSPSESPASAATDDVPAAPAPAPADDEDHTNDEEKKKKKKHASPAPAPTATMEVKSGEQVVVEEKHVVDGGKKAGVVVGAFSAAAVVGLAAVVWRKRQANIRRSRYADYSARLELV